MTRPLIDALTSSDPARAHVPLDVLVAGLDAPALLAACAELEAFRLGTDNLYQRVRALVFLCAIQRDHLLPLLAERGPRGSLPVEAHTHLLARRFEAAIAGFRAVQQAAGPDEANASALAAAYRGLAFATLADQVRASVQGVAGNRWMFEPRTVHDPHPLKLVDALRVDAPRTLREATPVRMDLSHSAWSDIFFLAMDDPAGARVLNVSIDLALHGSGDTPRPPVVCRLARIDTPVLRLHSIDLDEQVELSRVEQVFDFGADHLGLLRAAVVASGLVPPGVEAAGGELLPLLEQVLGAGRGLQLTTHVHGIPKGSRLAVSTTLLASLIALLMRATGQAPALTGALDEHSRRLACARAILGEWLGGSGGGWQDSGGLWPGLKFIAGERAGPGDPEHGTSTGRLLPRHELLGPRDDPGATATAGPDAKIGLPADVLERLSASLVLVHGGMAQDVGPVLEMVTERYLLRSQPEWDARAEAATLFDAIHDALRAGDLARLGAATHRNFFGPITTIVPWANNAFTERLVARVSERFGTRFLGFWMLGGMSGGGMGLLFRPDARAEAVEHVGRVLAEARAHFAAGLPFAMEPVVYDFAVNTRGTWAEWAGHTDGERRAAQAGDQAPSGTTPVATEPGDDLDALLARHGFDAARHESLRAALLAGRVGLARNRLPLQTVIEDARDDDVIDTRSGVAATRVESGRRALAAGELAVVTLAAGSGTRWTRGAGVVKALSPFVALAGAPRTFLELHCAKTARAARLAGTAVPHVVTTSHLTHPALAAWAAGLGQGAPRLSPGARIGLRLVPTVADLVFAWQHTPRARLDEQAQKLVESTEAALMAWAREQGEAADYRDNLPEQCIHPPGHAVEVPNLLLNGTLARLLAERPQLRTLLVHNVDTVGAWLDPGLLGAHRASGATFSFEVVPRRLEDKGGGLARIDGRLRLVESVALPREEQELGLSLYNSMTTWVEIDGLLALLGLDRGALHDAPRVQAACAAWLERLPTYVTLKEVKKRWGRGHEDVFPVLQAEQLWGDLTALPDARCAYLLVRTRRGRQLKEPAQLDGWMRDGSAAWVASLCDW